MSFDQMPPNAAFPDNFKNGVRGQLELRILKRCKIPSTVDR